MEGNVISGRLSRCWVQTRWTLKIAALSHQLNGTVKPEAVERRAYAHAPGLLAVVTTFSCGRVINDQWSACSPLNLV
jgi:hypothetical protein